MIFVIFLNVAMNVHSPKTASKDLPGFTLFYDQYAPKLWGLILLADLGVSESETILVKTFMKAWQHTKRQVIGENQTLTFLLSIAYAEGLPRVWIKNPDSL